MFLTDKWHPLPESVGSAFLLTTVQRFCSMLFTRHSSGAAVNRRLYPSTSVLKSKDPLPNFLWQKGTIFGAKARLIIWLLPPPPPPQPVMLLNDLHSLLRPPDHRSWSAGSSWLSFWPRFVIDHGVWVIWLSFISPF